MSESQTENASTQKEMLVLPYTDKEPASQQQQQFMQGFEFVCENEGYRYYKNTESGRQCCLDSAGNWYAFNEEKGAFEPMAFSAESTTAAPAQTAVIANKQQSKQTEKSNTWRNVERFGIRFNQHGNPVFPTNEKGLFVLPKDEKGSPFFPVDDRGIPIFPYDQEKGMPAFPVDDTEEPIFPRNDHNKPIVPKDPEGQPIFPVDSSGTFIFPLDESNCPIPALTTDGTPVVPKDEFGNFVVPRDRDGKPMIHIASDGVTPISMAEWKQWKKYYKEQARNFYQQQQHQQQAQMTQQIDVTMENYPMNSMFHPLNLEQQSAYFAANMEMLQRVRRVRPEDVDLPGQVEQLSGDANSKKTANGLNEDEEKLKKRKKFLQAQLKSKKIVIPPTKKASIDEEDPKRNGIGSQKETKKGIEKAKENPIESRKRFIEESRSRESSVGQISHDTVPKRRKLISNSSYSRSSSSSRSRSYLRSRSRSYSRSRSRSRSRSSRGNSRKSYGRRRQSSSSSSRSRSSSASYSSYSKSSAGSRRSASKSYTSNSGGEEERMRDRIIARTLSVPATNPTTITADPVPEADESLEYGPKPPDSLTLDSADMEISDGENEQPPPPPIVAPISKSLSEKHIIKFSEKFITTTMEETKKEEGVNNDKMTDVERERSDSLKVKEVLKSGDIALIRLCKEQERERYDQLKLQIAELDVEKSVHKRNWAQLREAEKRIEGPRNGQTLSTSSGAGSD